MLGLELVFIKFLFVFLVRLLLNIGGNDCWILVNLSNLFIIVEVKRFFEVKLKVKEVYFLVV